jgi:hypothetical protein
LRSRSKVTVCEGWTCLKIVVQRSSCRVGHLVGGEVAGTDSTAALEIFVLLERDLCRVVEGSHKFWDQARNYCLLGTVAEVLDTASDRSLPGLRNLQQQRTGTSKVANPSLLKHQEGLLLAFFGMTDIDS